MLRFAPSPTGETTLEELRLALLNYLAARQRGERFVLLLDDTAPGARPEEKEREILEIFGLFGIRHDDIHYRSGNLTIYRHMAIKLLQERRAFACFCAHERDEGPYEGGCDRLADAQVIDNPNPFTIRLKKPESPVAFDDLVEGPLAFAPETVDSFVILRTDKTPTPNFACAVDDMLLDVSIVLRQKAALPDTPRQIAVREALGYDRPILYAHLPALAGEAEGLSVRALLEEGFWPEAIGNYLLALSLESPQKIFTVEEAAAWFEPGRLVKKAPVFDPEALRELNREHMRRADAKELSRAFGFADAAVGDLAKCYLQECRTLREIRPRIDAIFAPKPYDGPEGGAMRALKEALGKAPLFDSYETMASHLAERTGLRGEALEKPLRLLLTGAEEGPPLAALYPHLKSYLQEIVK